MKNESISRRQILKMAFALGGVALTQRASSVLGQSVNRQLTPKQTMGPFYPMVRPLDHDADLTLIKGKAGQAQGTVIHVMGRVLDGRGNPVRGAQVELWQANTHGRYDHPRDINPAPLDPNFQGYGTQLTDAEGRYRFKTIKPGAYPENPTNPNNQRPPHIHFDITDKKQRLVTQMYFPNEPLNETDSIFRRLGSFRDAAICKILPPTKELEPDSLIALWDIVLAEG